MVDIAERFGNRIRVRVCALIYNDDKLLLVKHKHIGKDNIFWSPPGGGLEFGESSVEGLVREVLEETGIKIKKAHFQFINEFLDPPLHAVELFFNVAEFDGTVSTGLDPEMGRNQIIEDVAFVPFDELKIMHNNKKHNILHNIPSIKFLQSLSGYKRFVPGVEKE